LAATWRWPTLAQMNHSELSHMAGAVDDSTINIVEVIIIIIKGKFINNLPIVALDSAEAGTEPTFFSCNSNSQPSRHTTCHVTHQLLFPEQSRRGSAARRGSVRSCSSQLLSRRRPTQS